MLLYLKSFFAFCFSCDRSQRVNRICPSTCEMLKTKDSSTLDDYFLCCQAYSATGPTTNFFMLDVLVCLDLALFANLRKQHLCVRGFVKKKIAGLFLNVSIQSSTVCIETVQP